MSKAVQSTAARPVAPFLKKTFDLLSDPSLSGIISWTTAGDSFVVWDAGLFARDVLPLHFKHGNFSSFVRQLNTYGFRKSSSERWEFDNANFVRDSPDLLGGIIRRKARETQRANPQPLPNTTQLNTAHTGPLHAQFLDAPSQSLSGLQDQGWRQPSERNTGPLFVNHATGQGFRARVQPHLPNSNVAAGPEDRLDHSPDKQQQPLPTPDKDRLAHDPTADQSPHTSATRLAYSHPSPDDVSPTQKLARPAEKGCTPIVVDLSCHGTPAVPHAKPTLIRQPDRSHARQQQQQQQQQPAAAAAAAASSSSSSSSSKPEKLYASCCKPPLTEGQGSTWEMLRRWMCSLAPSCP
ncbi:MAG: hypothetical protein WDW38_006855 [Sanguina aurantia]